MPNWCENLLTITGGEKDIQRFQEMAKDQPDSELSLAKLYPMPAGIYQGNVGPDELTRYGAHNWYRWCIERWGTKWDVKATLLAATPKFLEFEFESAWSPPVKWLEKVAADFPRLRFVLHYDEPMMGFAGVAIAEQGRLIVDECTESA
jgi:Ferredoxin-like domain in Api92-like protein